MYENFYWKYSVPEYYRILKLNLPFYYKTIIILIAFLLKIYC